LVFAPALLLHRGLVLSSAALLYSPCRSCLAQPPAAAGPRMPLYAITLDCTGSHSFCTGSAPFDLPRFFTPLCACACVTAAFAYLTLSPAPALPLPGYTACRRAAFKHCCLPRHLVYLPLPAAPRVTIRACARLPAPPLPYLGCCCLLRSAFYGPPPATAAAGLGSLPLPAPRGYALLPLEFLTSHYRCTFHRCLFCTTTSTTAITADFHHSRSCHLHLPLECRSTVLLPTVFLPPLFLGLPFCLRLAARSSGFLSADFVTRYTYRSIFSTVLCRYCCLVVSRYAVSVTCLRVAFVVLRFYLPPGLPACLLVLGGSCTPACTWVLLPYLPLARTTACLPPAVPPARSGCLDRTAVAGGRSGGSSAAHCRAPAACPAGLHLPAYRLGYTATAPPPPRTCRARHAAPPFSVSPAIPAWILHLLTHRIHHLPAVLVPGLPAWVWTLTAYVLAAACIYLPCTDNRFLPPLPPSHHAGYLCGCAVHACSPPLLPLPVLPNLFHLGYLFTPATPPLRRPLHHLCCLPGTSYTAFLPPTCRRSAPVCCSATHGFCTAVTALRCHFTWVRSALPAAVPALVRAIYTTATCVHAALHLPPALYCLLPCSRSGF